MQGSTKIASSGEYGKAIIQFDQDLDAVAKVGGFLLYEMYVRLKHYQKRIEAFKPTMPKIVKNITENSNRKVRLWALLNNITIENNRKFKSSAIEESKNYKEHR